MYVPSSAQTVVSVALAFFVAFPAFAQKKYGEMKETGQGRAQFSIKQDEAEKFAQERREKRLQTIRHGVNAIDKSPARRKGFVKDSKLTEVKGSLRDGKLEQLERKYPGKVAQVKGQTVYLQSDLDRLGALGGSIAALSDRANLLRAYRVSFRALPEKFRRGIRSPKEVASQTELALIQTDYQRLQAQINTNISDILIEKQIGSIVDKPSGWTDDCTKEYGYDGGTDRSGTCSAYSTTGIMGRVNFPLKYYQTCVKNQGRRGTCASFATAAAAESLSYIKGSGPVNLSEQSLFWYGKVNTAWDTRYSYGLVTSEFVQELEDDGWVIPLEAFWRYNRSTSIVYPMSSSNEYTGSCTSYTGEMCTDFAFQSEEDIQSVVGIRIYTYEAPYAASGFKLEGVSSFFDEDRVDPTLSTVKTLLADKKPVVAALSATASFKAPNANGYVTYVSGEDTEDSGHAVLVVGWVPNTDLPRGAPTGSGGGYFVIKNSWGVGNGDCGYFYVPYDFMKDYAYALMSIGDLG